MRYGAPIGHDTGIMDYKELAARNHSGARSFPGDIDRYLVKEKRYKSVLGPFDGNPFVSDIMLSPLNSVPKADSQERRVIVDLSFPKGSSVNDGIKKSEYLGEPIKLEYPKVDDLVNIIKSKGRGCALFKRDLKRAYRQIPVCPGDYNLLAYCWKNEIYVDRVLPMALRSAAHICQRLTNAVTFIYSKGGWIAVNYLDDFGSAETWDKAEEAFTELGRVIKACGLEESPDKACSPNGLMIFLGVLFNTNDLTLSVTEERLSEILQLLDSWVRKVSATHKEVQKLIGKLNFVAKCVRPGRIFISRMLEFLRSFTSDESQILCFEFRKDVDWWVQFLPLYNGVSMMAIEEWSEPDEVFACDACLVGAGGWCNGQYFHCSFPEFIQQDSLHINALELLTVIVCVKLWGSQWKGQRIVVACDNLVSVDVINSGRARDRFLLKCLRELLFLAASFEFEIRARHIPGVTNRIPDLLSRFKLNPRCQKKFFELTEHVQKSECLVSDELFKFIHYW
jgi:hypothetical protein